MAVDDGWEGMTAADVKSYASSSATQSYGTVWNLKLSASLILKVIYVYSFGCVFLTVPG